MRTCGVSDVITLFQQTCRHRKHWSGVSPRPARLRNFIWTLINLINAPILSATFIIRHQRNIYVQRATFGAAAQAQRGPVNDRC